MWEDEYESVRSLTGPASRPSANRMREAPTAQASEAPKALTTPPKLIRFLRA